MSFTELYDVLGVPPTAQAEEIKLGYRRANSATHPDKNPNDPLASSKFDNVQAAYAILSDPAKKAQYDKYGIADGMPEELQSAKHATARKELASLFMFAVQRMSDPGRENPLNTVLQQLRTQRDQLTGQRHEAFVLRTQLAKSVDRITLQPHATTKVNVLRDSLVAKIAAMVESDKSMAESIIQTDLMITLLHEYGYILDQPVQSPVVGGFMTPAPPIPNQYFQPPGGGPSPAHPFGSPPAGPKDLFGGKLR